MWFAIAPPTEERLAARAAVSGSNIKRLKWMREYIVIKTLTKLQKNLPVIIKIYFKKQRRPEKYDPETSSRSW
jgi:hypothetical protein